jgi:hypothetical protein
MNGRGINPGNRLFPIPLPIIPLPIIPLPIIPLPLFGQFKSASSNHIASAARTYQSQGNSMDQSESCEH